MAFLDHTAGMPRLCQSVKLQWKEANFPGYERLLSRVVSSFTILPIPAQQLVWNSTDEINRLFIFTQLNEHQPSFCSYFISGLFMAQPAIVPKFPFHFAWLDWLDPAAFVNALFFLNNPNFFYQWQCVMYVPILLRRWGKQVGRLGDKAQLGKIGME